ncbi:tail fiber protein [Aquimarina sp. MMG016]|uniref:phage tail protein n=1 Tax=Aquimarina sp. MMG016 TaxID=2822690 RepID=UPI001B39FAEC|nr:tail fiber protein [Aquimarina sp. MMG016]MBQ4818778.1 phage tail protein [Aquimarina sp. MMG016]
MDGYISEIRLWGPTWAPRNWALCNGQVLAISQNQSLFSLIGTTYGGDGRTSFALPDLRGRTAIGSGHGPGLSSYNQGQQVGSETNMLTNLNLPAHHHAVVVDGSTNSLNASVSIPVINDEATVEESDGSILAVASSDNSVTTKIYGPSNASDGKLAAFNSPVTGNINTLNTGNNQPLNNIQPSLGLHYIICLQGIYPSRN